MLYKNNHDGTFADVTEHSGLATPGFTTSAVWFDYDNDGRLDLFVCSFVDYSGVRKLECGNNQIGRNYYCVPRVFKPSSSFLYHNNGDGTFTDEMCIRDRLGSDSAPMSPCGKLLPF